MTYSSSLTDDLTPLIFDTSVLINLYACSYGERILTAVPNGIIVPQVVAGEFEHETSRKNGEHRFLHDLIAGGKVTLGNMTDEENVLFANLASGSPSLGDGEAATIAIAANRQFLPLIDDRKARALAFHLLRGQEPGWSLDLFRHASVTSALGGTAAIVALYLALRDISGASRRKNAHPRRKHRIHYRSPRQRAGKRLYLPPGLSETLWAIHEPACRMETRRTTSVRLKIE